VTRDRGCVSVARGTGGCGVTAAPLATTATPIAEVSKTWDNRVVSYDPVI